MFKIIGLFVLTAMLFTTASSRDNGGSNRLIENSDYDGKYNNNPSNIHSSGIEYDGNEGAEHIAERSDGDEGGKGSKSSSNDQNKWPESKPPTKSIWATTSSPTTASPTTASPLTGSPKTSRPTTVAPTTVSPTASSPTTVSPTTLSPITASPTTASPTTTSPTTSSSTTNIDCPNGDILSGNIDANDLFVAITLNCLSNQILLNMTYNGYTNNWFGLVFNNIMFGDSIIWTHGKNGENLVEGLHSYDISGYSPNNVVYNQNKVWSADSIRFNNNGLNIIYFTHLSNTPWTRDTTQIQFRYAIGDTLELRKHIQTSELIYTIHLKPTTISTPALTFQ